MALTRLHRRNMHAIFRPRNQMRHHADARSSIEIQCQNRSGNLFDPSAHRFIEHRIALADLQSTQRPFLFLQCKHNAAICGDIDVLSSSGDFKTVHVEYDHILAEQVRNAIGNGFGIGRLSKLRTQRS